MPCMRVSNRIQTEPVAKASGPWTAIMTRRMGAIMSRGSGPGPLASMTCSAVTM